MDLTARVLEEGYVDLNMVEVACKEAGSNDSLVIVDFRDQLLVEVQ